jgi:hypothetical protein
MVGVIRWLRIGGAGAVDAGIELLALEARAAVVRSMDAYNHPRPSVRGLVLQSEPDEGGHASAVLAPAVLERNAPRYEFRALPVRWSGGDEIEILQVQDIDIAEHTASVLRISLRAPARASAPGALAAP